MYPIMEWKRDWNLTGRIWLTMFLLFILYLVFMTVLVAFGVGYWFIALFAVGMGFDPVFFLGQTGSLVNRSPDHCG